MKTIEIPLISIWAELAIFVAFNFSGGGQSQISNFFKLANSKQSETAKIENSAKILISGIAIAFI